MNRIIAIATFIALAIATTPSFARPELAPIVNYEDQVIKTSFENRILSMEEVQKAIRRAAARKDWVVVPGENGHIIGTLVVQNYHTVVVDIAYDQHKFSITYKSSINMNYEPAGTTITDRNGEEIGTTREAHIHPNYNNWVSELKDAISIELQD